jgi:hypothetical protein
MAKNQEAQASDHVHLVCKAARGQFPKLGLFFVNGRTKITKAKFDELSKDPDFKRLFGPGKSIGREGMLKPPESSTPKVISNQSGATVQPTVKNPSPQDKEE